MRIQIEWIGEPDKTTEWTSEVVPRLEDFVEVNGIGAPVKVVLWSFKDGEAPYVVVRLHGPAASHFINGDDRTPQT